MASEQAVARGISSTVVITTDKGCLDLDYIHTYLSEQSYWARGRSRADVEKSILHSLCFGVYVDGHQVGFARVITDYTLLAWLADVFIDERTRGRGLGKRLIETIVNHPELREIRRFMLATSDAHELYRRYGFDDLSHRDRLMARIRN